MPRRRLNAAEQIIITDPVPVEDLDDSTVEEYKRLNDKLDGCITKIKSRKESKKK